MEIKQNWRAMPGHAWWRHIGEHDEPCMVAQSHWSLDILHQHDSKTNPMGAASITVRKS